MLGLPEVRGAIPNSVYDGFSGDDLRNSRGPSLETLRPEIKDPVARPVRRVNSGHGYPFCGQPKALNKDVRLCYLDRWPTAFKGDDSPRSKPSVIPEMLGRRGRHMTA